MRGLRAGCAFILRAEAEALTAGDVRRALPDADADAVTRAFLRADGSKFGAAGLPALEADADALRAALQALARTP